MYSTSNSISIKLRALTLQAVALLSLVVFNTGCETETLVAIDEPPPAPQGVYTIRGDQEVTIHWLPVEASDLSYYRVYWGADSSNGSAFELVGETTNEFLTDDVDLTNGTRYYYTVTAVDLGGNESTQSREWGGATPRDEGSVVVTVSNSLPLSAGFDFSAGVVVAYNSQLADIWFDRDGSGVVYINADTIPDPTLGDIQDMGFTQDLDEISRAPEDGWSFLGYSEAIVGHTYVVWTDTDNYAKVRLVSVSADVVFIEYAYQPGEAWAGGGEPELAPSVKSEAISTIDRSTGAHRTDITVRPKTSSATSGAGM